MTNCLKIELSPKIYVVCLSSYVNGISYGAWINVSQPLEDILTQIKQLLSKSPMPDAEEFGIHACEGFGSWPIREYESITTIHEKALFIVEHGKMGAELIAYYSGDLGDAKKALDGYYVGEYDSELSFATDLFDDLYLDDIPDSAQFYVDYDKFRRDIFINDYFSVKVDGRCYVFIFH